MGFTGGDLVFCNRRKNVRLNNNRKIWKNFSSIKGTSAFHSQKKEVSFLFRVYSKSESIRVGELPWWRSGWESACQCRGHGFGPWSGKIPCAAPARACACALEPASHGCWGLRAWSPCPAAGEAPAVRGPRTGTGSGPRSPRLEKAPTQPKIKTYINT